jgi:hypothetical protein
MTTKLSDPFDPNSPLVPKAVGYTEIVDSVSSSVPCVSGKCLKVHMLEGSHGNLAAKWQLANANLQPQELYLSYYIYLSDNWQVTWPGGKFPGLSDVRVPGVDPVGQCGNGGAPSDGINCWSMRANFGACVAGGKDSCANVGKPNATTRFGSYLYTYANDVFAAGTGWGSHWDTYYWDRMSAPSGTSCDSNPFNQRCAMNDLGMLENGRWYHIEMYIKMNTPLQKEPSGSYDKAGLASFFDGKGDGIIRGWVDGQLVYEKENAIFRLIGHDNLHVRTVWLDVFMGGSTTNPHNQAIYLDQMVVSKTRVGPRGLGALPPTNTQAPARPENLQVD